jgi:acyl dehydratase
MSDIASIAGRVGFPNGTSRGVSGWLRVTQELIDGFARYTLDPDPMHIDPAWAARNSPFGSTIAFGFLTMSLLTHLLHDAQGVGGEGAAEPDPARDGYYLNYGFDRLRLVAPVPVNSEVRGIFEVRDARIDEKGRHVFKMDCTIEIKDAPRPALVGEWLSVWVPAEPA